MIDLYRISNIYLYPGLTDMRLGIIGLKKKIMATNQIKDNTLYIFCGHQRNQLKIIEVNKYATWLYQNKLHQGKFIWPINGDITDISQNQLRMILEGITFIQKIEKTSIKKDLF